MRHTVAILVAVVAMGASGIARADEFRLANGGTLRGEWRNPGRRATDDYELTTEQGVRLTLADRLVREVVRQSPQQLEYERLAPTYPHTVAAQWQLAEWCRERGLAAERRRHLEQVLALDAQHVAARRALGYAFINGEWTTIQAEREKDGYVKYRGSWRTIQDVELFEAQAKRQLAEKDWAARLKRWRADLETPQRAKSAQEAILAIRTVDAVGPLTGMISREGSRPVKMLLADALANINAPDAATALVQTSLHDPDGALLHYALVLLLKNKTPGLAEQYIRALKDANNQRVNRAAVALATIGDRTALSPLIDALTTQHATIVPGSGSAPAGGYRATFSKGTTDALGTSGGGNSFVQNDDPKITVVSVRNEEVLTSLTRLSGGANFGYDAKAWRYWLAQEKKREQAGGTATRRD